MKTERSFDASGLLPDIAAEAQATMDGLTKLEGSMQVYGGWRIYIETIAHGQLGPYKGSVWAARFVLFNSHNNRGVPQLAWPTRSTIMTLGKLFVSDYKENPAFLERRFTHCKPVELPYGMPIGVYASNRDYLTADDGTIGYRAPCWEYRVDEPYND